MNSNQRVVFSEKEKSILKLFYVGGLQTYLPRDESEIYLNDVFLDSIKFCVKDFSKSEPSDEEKHCMKSFLTKNYQLLNSNLSNLN
jgi:hypothetical protein